MNCPANQHWVPQFYLKYFSTPETRGTKNPKAWIFSKDERDGDPVLTNIRNICGRRYLYSPNDEEGQREWALENKLSDLESLLAGIWPSLAEGFVDLHADPIRKGVALFIAVLILRNPDQLAQCEDAHRHLLKIYEEAPKQPDGTPNISFIKINGQKHQFDTTGWHKYRNWDKNDHHRFFADCIHSHATDLAKILLKKRWSVVVSETPAFVTSDKPVGKENLEKERFGFDSKGTMVTFPLSPTRVLVMDDRHDQPAGQYYALLPDGPGPWNYSVWRNSNRFMISPRNTDEVIYEICSLQKGWREGNHRNKLTILR